MDLARLLAPLPANPDWKDDERVMAAEAVLEPIFALGAVDWPAVVEAGERVLGEVTKDLKTAVCVAHAYAYVSGIAGMADGFVLLEGLLRTQWSALEPPRDKARQKQASWLIERTKVWLEGSESAAEASVVSAAQAAVEALAVQLDSRFAGAGAEARALSPLLAARGGGSVADGRTEPSAPAHGAAPSPPAPDVVAAVAPGPAPAAAPTIAAAAPAAPVDPLVALRAEHAARIAPLLAPIAGAAPQGRNTRGSEAMSRLREAVERAVDRGTSWREVEDVAKSTLIEHGKDFQVACYLGAAWIREEGLSGSIDTLGLLGQLAQLYWDTGYPELARLSARQKAFEWLFDQARKQWSSLVLEPRHKAEAQLLAKLAGELRAIVLAKGGPTDELDLAVGASERLRKSVPEPPKPEPPKPVAVVAPRAPTPTPTPATVTPPAPPAPAVAAAPAAVAIAVPSAAVAAPADTAQADDFLRNTGRELMSLAGNLRTAQAGTPRAYFLSRIGQWLHLEVVPPAGTKLGVGPLDARAVAKLEQLRTGRAWAALLDEAESLTRTNLWAWVLHWYVDQALAGLGHAEARVWLASALRAILERFPQVFELSFRDGAPVLAGEARAWCEGLVRAAAPASSGAGGAEDPALVDARAQVAKALAAGDVGELVRTAEAAARTLSSGLSAYELRLSTAEALLGAGHTGVARALLLTLDAEAERRGLDEFMPALAARTLSALARALRASGRDPKELARELAPYTQRMLRVDPKQGAAWAT
jgi:type VI secretion system ImpA/VasJ family protein